VEGPSRRVVTGETQPMKKPKPRRNVKAKQPKKKQGRPNPAAEIGKFLQVQAGDMLIRAATLQASFNEKVLLASMIPGMLAVIRSAVPKKSLSDFADDFINALQDQPTVPRDGAYPSPEASPEATKDDTKPN
jgi:hypothetical protein